MDLFSNTENYNQQFLKLTIILSRPQHINRKSKVSKNIASHKKIQFSL